MAMTKVWKLARLLAVTAALLLASACIPVGETQMESRTVDLAGAQAVDVEITMGVGELRRGGGARELLEAEFIYNVPDWQPEVDYYVSGGHGRLTVRQPHSSGVRWGDVRYTWDLRLKNNLPMALTVSLGAGKSELELAGLAVSRLDVRLGAGETTLDLTGDWQADLDANIKGGVGRATVRLPADVGVRVYAKAGLGRIHARGLKSDGRDYVNAAYGKSKVTLRISIEAGIGEINLEAREYII